MTASCAGVCANCGTRNPSGDDQKDTAGPPIKGPPAAKRASFRSWWFGPCWRAVFGNPSYFVWAFWLPDSFASAPCSPRQPPSRSPAATMPRVLANANAKSSPWLLPQILKELLHPCKEAFALWMSPGVLAAGLFEFSQQLLLALVQIYRGFDCSFDEHIAAGGRAQHG